MNSMLQIRRAVTAEQMMHDKTPPLLSHNKLFICPFHSGPSRGGKSGWLPRACALGGTAELGGTAQ